LKILYKYILKESYPPAILSLAVFSFILIINLLFQLAELIVEQGFSLYKGSLFFIAALPVLLSYTVPIATLSGVLIAVSRLSSDREITANESIGSQHIKPFNSSFNIIFFSFDCPCHFQFLPCPPLL